MKIPWCHLVGLKCYGIMYGPRKLLNTTVSMVITVKFTAERAELRNRHQQLTYRTLWPFSSSSLRDLLWLYVYLNSRMASLEQ